MTIDLSLKLAVVGSYSLLQSRFKDEPILSQRSVACQRN